MAKRVFDDTLIKNIAYAIRRVGDPQKANEKYTTAEMSTAISDMLAPYNYQKGYDDARALFPEDGNEVEY